MTHPNENCKELGPIILFFVILEAIFLQMIFIGLRLIIVRPRILCCVGLPETLLAFLIIGYFGLVPTCDMLS
jgi:hypothetical protein